ncbi:hypothetical protein V6L77_20695 [Pannonibacter sp. Pt2-lr]
MKLNAALGPDDPLPADDLRFDIMGMNFNAIGEREVIVSGVKPDAIVRLNAGTYHVVSRYGDVNAIVRADISVEAGKLTSATLFQNAASVTLKLVNDPGGEAIANTAWTILTPGGDTVVEGNGAFPPSSSQRASMRWLPGTMASITAEISWSSPVRTRKSRCWPAPRHPTSASFRRTDRPRHPALLSDGEPRRCHPGLARSAKAGSSIPGAEDDERRGYCPRLRGDDSRRMIRCRKQVLLPSP